MYAFEGTISIWRKKKSYKTFVILEKVFVVLRICLEG